MAIHVEQNIQMSGGFSKQIDQGAIGLIFDNLQKSQYMYPIKSTIRELASNGLDSIREKGVARSILSGESRIEDHYEQLEGEVYKDSHFNAEYYDLAFLSPENNVVIEYHDGGATGKDFVIIKDTGVGLGGKRLAGYFNLGYSTKRLSRYPLGKFGLGAKSPLSTGAPFYTATSRHNGREYQFNIYSHKAESIVPRWDVTSGTENPSFTLPGVEDEHGVPIIMYYRPTKAYNGLEIELQVKKHHMKTYLESVSDQLMYFDNVKLYTVDTNGVRTEVPVKANIMYEDEYIVMAERSPYTKPHILLNTVNYGLIDFKELELEDRMGNVGIKVIPDLVSVNPSRESLIWDDVTREVVINRFKEVMSIAENMVSKELKETDFLRWVKACALASGSSKWWHRDGSTGKTDATVMGRLSSIVDLSTVEMAYSVDPSVKYSYKLFAGITNRIVKYDMRKEGSKTIKKVDYTPGIREALTNGLPVLLQHSATSNRKNKYILDKLYPTGFISILLETDKPGLTPDKVQLSDRIDEVCSVFRQGLRNDKIVEKYDSKFAREYIAKLHNYILTSEDIAWYEDIVVPDDYSATEHIEEEQEEEKSAPEQKAAVLSAAERRKQTGSTLIHALRVIPDVWRQEKANKCFEFCAVDIQFNTIDKWSNKEVFWGNQNDEVLLHMAGLIMRPFDSPTEHMDASQASYDQWRARGYSQVSDYDYNHLYAFHDKAPVRLFKVSQNNVRYYQDFNHVTKFFKIIRNKTITMANALVEWNTARLISKHISQLAFLQNFGEVSRDKYEAYHKLKNYMGKYYRSIDDIKKQGAGEMAYTLTEHLDRVGDFQLFVRQNPTDTDAIARLAKSLFNPEQGIEITDGFAINTEMYDLLMEMLDWSAPVYTLMNMVEPLVNKDTKHVTINDEIKAIADYFTYKGVPL